MKTALYGFVLFFRESSTTTARGFGFVYHPEQDRTFYFHEGQLQDGYTLPRPGDTVLFEEGLARAEKGLATGKVWLTALTNSAAATISLKAVMKSYRLTAREIYDVLAYAGIPVQSGDSIRLTIKQLQQVYNWIVLPKDVLDRGIRPPEDQFYLGEVQEFVEQRGFCFVKVAGKPRMILRTQVLKQPATKGEWLALAIRPDSSGKSSWRVYWASPIQQEISWLQNSFHTLKPEEKIGVLQQPELAQTILTWQLNALPLIDTEARYDEACELLTHALNYAPVVASTSTATVLEKATAEFRWLLWSCFGDLERMPDSVRVYLLALKDNDQARTGNWQYIRQGLLPLDLEDYLLVLSQWWTPTTAANILSEGMEPLLGFFRELSALFFAPVTESAKSRLTLTGKATKRYFADLALPSFSAALWQEQGMVLPESEFVAAFAGKFTKFQLEELLEENYHDTGMTAAFELLKRIGPVDDTAAYRKSKQLLVHVEKNYAASPDFYAQLLERVVTSSTAPLAIDLWTVGFAAAFDILPVLGTLPESDLRELLHHTYRPIRPKAAHVLLARWAAQDDVKSIREGLSLLFELKSLIFEQELATLLNIFPASGVLYSTISQWRLAGNAVLDIPTLLHWIQWLRDQAANPLEAITLLSTDDKLALWEYVFDTDPDRLFQWESQFLVSWLLLLPSESRVVIILRLPISHRHDLLLDLWLGGHSDYFEFTRYYLLVATLKKEEQLLFLRKVFGLMAAGSTTLTVEELNSIPRHSAVDDNPLDRKLDYSIDLVMRVLMTLKQNSSYPTEGDIVECLINYAGNSTRELLQFSHLFEDCPGRTTVKYSPPERVTRVIALIGSKRYAAASDKSYIQAREEKYPVIQNSIEFNGKSYPIIWEEKTETKWPWSLELENSNGNRGVSCCEGKKALANDKDTEKAFWWCYGRPCHKANQQDHAPEQWQAFVLRDFISIAGLHFEEEAYYRIIGLINRINELISKLYCADCGLMLRPHETSNYNFFRVSKFSCKSLECASKDKVIYLSKCLNFSCGAVIDSRVSARCNYEDVGHANWTGMYICENCGGCCSRQKLLQQIDKLKQVYGSGVNSQRQYNSLVKQLDLKLYHADKFKSYCYKCLSPMEKARSHGKADLICPKCDGVKYQYEVAYLTVYNKNKVPVAKE